MRENFDSRRRPEDGAVGEPAGAGEGGASPGTESGGAARLLLRERELVVLQLYARGHSLATLDSLLAPERAPVLLARAARALGVTTPAEAVAEARRRGLIV